MSAAAGNGLGITLNYLRGAAGNGRAQRSSTFDAQQALQRATAWASR
jgi:membrane protein YqaA with SNARE-associated domain